MRLACEGPTVEIALAMGDAWLTWIGARLLVLGVFDLGFWGLGGYWLDAAWVGGEERLNGPPGDRP